MSPNEPKRPPFTRTLPAVDVVVESDAPPPTSRVSPPFTIRAADVEALRQGVQRATEDSDAPAPRPSLPVRAARATKDKSPWIAVGVVLVEVIRLVLQSL